MEYYIIHHPYLLLIDGPCGARPCLNGGICTTNLATDVGFTCDCTNTGFVGGTCAQGKFSISTVQGVFYYDISVSFFILQSFSMLFNSADKQFIDSTGNLYFVAAIALSDESSFFKILGFKALNC